MAFLTLNTQKLKENYNYLDSLFHEKNIKWSVVTKLLCGNKNYLKELINLGMEQVCDSRVSNLKTIKEIAPSIETIYIKPAPRRFIKSVVEYADISVNTEFQTIKLLAREAELQGKIHKIIIMIEMGELREGVMREDFIEFYAKVFRLPNIEVVGIGTNLSCLYGVLPSHDKLIQLCIYKQLIEAKFNKTIPFISGGSSVTISLIHQNLLPASVNHFRVGETLFLGTDVYNNIPVQGMHSDVFRLYAQIIELINKPAVPTGELGHNVEGDTPAFDKERIGLSSYRAIIDIGLLDVDKKHILAVDPEIKYVGASSDMIVIDLGRNEKNYKVGDMLEFKLDYMGTLRTLNSKYIEKRIAGKSVEKELSQSHPVAV